MATTTRTPKTIGKTAAIVAKPAVKKISSAKKPATKKPAPAAKKPAAKVTATTTDKVAKPALKRKPVLEQKPALKQKKATSIPDEQRRHMIATAAYYLAEQRGFSGACEVQDWIAAEMQIEAQLNSTN